MSLYPFPYGFMMPGGRRSLTLLESGAVLDLVSLTTESRVVRKEIQDTAAGAEAIGLPARALTLAEAGAIFDAAGLDTTSRIRDLGIEDLALGAETVELLKDIALAAVEESGTTLDEVSLSIASRQVQKAVEDVAVGAETIELLKDVAMAAVQESGSALDDVSLAVVSRQIQKAIEDLAGGSETITLGYTAIPPAIPSVSVASSGVTSVTATIGSVATADRYDLRYRTSTDGSSWGGWTTVLDVGSGSEGISCDEAEHVQVEARAVTFAADGSSADSGWGNADSAQSDVLTPGAPSSVDMALSNGGAWGDDGSWSHTVTWSAGSNATGYDVRRSINGAAYTTESEHDGGSPFVDSGLNSHEGDQFRYAVRSQRTVNGKTAHSGFAYGPTERIPLEAPTGLSVSTVDDDSLDLDWTNNSEADSHVRIYRNGVHIDSVTSLENSYRDTGLSPDTTYSYEVRAYNSSTGQESHSGVTTDSGTTEMTAPSNLNASDASYCSSGFPQDVAVVTWSAGTTSGGWETVVEREDLAGSGDYTAVAVVSSSTEEWEDTNPSDDGCAYRVYHRRTDNSDPTAYSNTDTWNQRAGVCPAGTPAITASDGSVCSGGTMDYEVDLSWTPLAGWNVRVEYREGTFGSWTHLDDYGDGTGGVTHDHGNMGDGDGWYYRARYESGSSTGAWSSTSDVILENRCNPTIDSCSAALGGFTGTEIQVSWTPGDLCESVTVYLHADNGTILESADRDAEPNVADTYGFVGYGAGTYYAEVRPYSGDNQTGSVGSDCVTGDVTIEGGGPGGPGDPM